MRNNFRYILFILIIFTVNSLVAQTPYVFKNLSKKDGLSQASVFAIAQDSTGFMWFGTRDGLNKFDGYQFKVYKKNQFSNSLIANDIRTLYFDSLKKELWIGTIAGLSKYQSTSDDFVNFIHSKSDTNSISNNEIRQIFRDSKGRLWITTSAGLNILDEKTNQFKRFYINDQSVENKKNQDVNVVLEDKNGKIWLGTVDGLFLLKEDNNKGFSFKRIDKKPQWKLSDTHIKSMLEDKEGNFWVGTFEGGINFWDKNQDTIIIYKNEKNNPNSLSHNTIRSLCLDENDDLWIGTFGGLNFLKKNTNSFKRFTKSDAGMTVLSDNSIRSIFIDKRGSLWLGTYYGGINYLDENYNRFTNFKHAPIGNVLSGDVISSFAEDKKGNLWIGTEGDGLNFYNKTTKQFKSYQFQSDDKNSLSGNYVKQLLLDEKQLWIGTFQAGLNLFDTETEVFQHFKNNPNNNNSLSSNNVYGLHKEDNLLWILTYGGGLNILDLNTYKFYHYNAQTENDNSISSELTRVILKTKNGQLWIGTEKGLNKVSKNENGLPDNFKVFLAHEKIYSLQEDSQQNIWIGTFSNGMYLFQPKSNVFKHFTTSDGLPGNTVFGILEEGNELWLSTNNGLAKFNPAKESFTNYNYSNGLENSEYNFNAYYKTKDGDFLFGGINGFTQFNPKMIQANQFIPPVIFTELRKNNEVISVGDDTQLLTKSINETTSITFNYNEANFSIGFAALDFFSPENNHYAFKLEGIDKDWNYSTGKTEATYTIQKDGEYVLRMKGGNSDGIWNPKDRQLEIIVLPPPWKTWWAYLIYIGTIGMLVYGLVHFIRLRHKLQLEQIEKQQQEELHEVKLRFFTNITHEFRTPLTLILGPLKELISKEEHTTDVKKQLSLIERNTQRLLNLVNQVLTFRKLATDHGQMNIVHGNIVEFLQEIFLPFQESANSRNIDYTFESSFAELEAWFDQDKLEKVFFNLLSNAFKFTADGEAISMTVTQNNQYIEVKVKDNGIGVDTGDQDQIFKRFYEKSAAKHSNIKGTGIGLAISKQMIELHHGKISVENTIPKGATFVVLIPKGKSHFGEQTTIKTISNVEKISDYRPVILTQRDEENNVVEQQKSISENSELLLIVEDNPEVRTYIQQIFKDDYRTTTANNGKEGLKKTKKELPTLIISDVMMPEMDGITFCHKLKTDFEISHIPIVLLTARTASLFKIEGLKTGADDYITKPFIPEELRLRVRNIIKARKEARDKFARVMTFDPKEISITSADELFLEKALEIVEKQMGNYEYKVAQFAFDLAVSRSLLFTKIKALTGQTPNNFIKTIRLKRAAQLLKTQKLNVSEVADMVGFKDPKYFRKCFKEQFMMLPSDYGENG